MSLINTSSEEGLLAMLIQLDYRSDLGLLFEPFNFSCLCYFLNEVVIFFFVFLATLIENLF